MSDASERVHQRRARHIEVTRDVQNLMRENTEGDRVMSARNSFIASKASVEQVLDTAVVMDKSWENIQKKTFLNWMNNQLNKKSIPPISNLETDVSSGVSLIQLLEVISDESLGKYNKAPKMRIQKMENLTLALDFIRKKKVQLTNIGAEDIVDANLKLILGLLWTIILRFSISEISEEGLSAKEGLLLWCQKRTTPYVSDFTIKEFTFSWQSGLALCGLIHRHRPDLLDYWALDKSKKHENTQLAFDIAEKHLGIPKLFGVEDIVDVVKPDERSVMTYVAQYFHAFSVQDKFGTAARRVGGFAEVMQQAWQMEHDYEMRVKNLKLQVENMAKTWKVSSFNGYSDAIRQLKEFEAYKGTTKRSWIAERRELDTLLGNIQTKLQTYKLNNYVPPPGLTLEDLSQTWDNLLATEASRKRSITASIREIKDSLRKRYADAANKFAQDLSAIANDVVIAEGTLETQLTTFHGFVAQLDILKKQLPLIVELNAQCEIANIEDNEYTIYSVEDLDFDANLLGQSLKKKLAFIENQIVARSMTNITAEQLEEYSQTFKSCDKANTNLLDRDGFKLALKAEGEEFSDEEFEKLFLSLSDGKEGISFETYIGYMKSEQEDRVTVDQLQNAFSTLAIEKNFITKQDLLTVGLSPETVEFLAGKMPQKDGGYDFEAFLKESFC